MGKEKKVFFVEDEFPFAFVWKAIVLVLMYGFFLGPALLVMVPYAELFGTVPVHEQAAAMFLLVPLPYYVIILYSQRRQVSKFLHEQVSVRRYVQEEDLSSE